MSPGSQSPSPGASGTRLIAPGLRTRFVDDTALEPLEEYRSTLTADFADIYRRGEDHWSSEDAMRETPRLLVEALGATARGARVLDVGCGRGIDVETLALLGARPVGLDLIASPDWPSVVDRCPEAEFLTGDLVDLVESGAIEPGSFRAVLDNGCMHHQHPDRIPAFLAAVRRVLLAGGLFVISVFGAGDAGGALTQNEAKRLFRDFTEDELVGLGRDHGFVPESVRAVARASELVYLVGVFRSARP